MVLVILVSIGTTPAEAKNTGNGKITFPQSNICTVADPTGTPLNVRAEPINGKIVAKLKNGTVVRVEDFNEEYGDELASWWQISISKNGKRRTLGWVTSKFLNCN